MKISRITVFRKDLIPSSGQDEYLYTDSKFDPDTGLLIEEIRYTPDGQVEEAAKREYNSKGLLTLSELTDGEGIIIEKRTFETDAQGRTIREFIHYFDETTDRIENTLDDEGRLVRRELFDESDQIETLEIFQFNGDKLTRQAELESNGEVIKEKLFSYSEKGLLDEEILIDNAEGLYVKKEFYHNQDDKVEEIMLYDKAGEPIERYIYSYDEEGRPMIVIEETKSQKNSTTFHYNENGEVILEEETDHKGNLVKKVERSYNENGLISETKVLTNNIAYGIIRSYVLTSNYSLTK